MATPGRLPSFVLLERLGVALLLLAAFVPRARDFTRPFDREFEGFQGSCFATFVVNYERLGIAERGGYPAFNIDLPAGELDDELYIYANHPPTIPILCWASVKLFGPDGWEDAWQAGEPPEGIEPALRFPFLAFHMLGLLAFWWAVRQGGGPRIAMLSLALLALTPVSILYAQLVNYENPSFPFVFLGYGFHARAMRGRDGPNVLLVALCFLIATSITFAPLFFLPPLVLQAAWRQGWRAGLRHALTIGLVAMTPVVVHGLWVRATLPAEASDAVLVRARELLSPLFSGTEPLHEWLRRQFIRAGHYLTWPLLVAAAAGLVISLRGLRKEHEEGAPLSIGIPLLAGGLLYLFAFYTHTFDGEGLYDSQTIFLINLGPGVACLAAIVLDALAAPLARLRGGIAPLVVATLMLGIPGIARANAVRQLWREPGPRDDPALSEGPGTALPITAGREIAALLPPNSIGFYPLALGFNQAPAYYAWRTLVGVDRDSFGMRVGMLEQRGLAELPKYLIVPKDPTPATAAQLAEVKETLAEMGSPVAEDDRWEVWALQE